MDVHHISLQGLQLLVPLLQLAPPLLLLRHLQLRHAPGRRPRHPPHLLGLLLGCGERLLLPLHDLRLDLLEGGESSGELLLKILPLQFRDWVTLRLQLLQLLQLLLYILG